MFKWLIILMLLATPAMANEVAVPDQIMVMVKFREHTPRGDFNDALFFTQDEYAKLKPAELQAKKDERVQNWLNILNNPPVEDPLSDEQVEQRIQEMDARIDDIVAQRAEMVKEAEAREIIVEAKEIKLDGVVKEVNVEEIKEIK